MLDLPTLLAIEEVQIQIQASRSTSSSLLDAEVAKHSILENPKAGELSSKLAVGGVCSVVRHIQKNTAIAGSGKKLTKVFKPPQLLTTQLGFLISSIPC